MKYSFSSGHYLHITRLRHAFVSQMIAVPDGALANIGDNLHISVAVQIEALARRDGVVVPDLERAEAGSRRVDIAAKREVMVCRQPVVLKAAKAFEGTVIDHDAALSLAAISVT